MKMTLEEYLYKLRFIYTFVGFTGVKDNVRVHERVPNEFAFKNKFAEKLHKNLSPWVRNELSHTLEEYRELEESYNGK